VSAQSDERKALRRDAQRNRDHLLTAARAAFTEDGVAASLEGIAGRAGVGIGTLYRHFPSREALVEAVFDDQVGAWLAAAERAAGADDAWQGLCEYLERMLELQAEHRALHDVFMQDPGGERHAEARAEMRRLLERVLARAREQGALRGDYTAGDLAMLFWSLGPVLDATASIAPHAARRHLGLVLDGLRAGAATAQVDPPLTDAELAEATRSLRERRFKRPSAVKLVARGGAR
jgi:AcrR family transcriptional regulator